MQKARRIHTDANLPLLIAPNGLVLSAEVQSIEFVFWRMFASELLNLRLWMLRLTQIASNFNYEYAWLFESAC